MDFDAVYKTYFQDVYRYILKLSGDLHIAEDITSETFFKAMKSLDKFRGECDVRVWLCQIGKNCYFSYCKKHRPESLEEDIPDPTPSPEAHVTAQDSASRIRALLQTLPEPYREVFLWRIYGELSFKEIGKLFQKTDNWACVTYHRARSVLKKKLEDQDEIL